MTYPPPGQPGPHGQQGPYGPGGQPYGQQPQPGYPGSPQQFGQQGPWGQQTAGYPGFPGGEPPKKKKTGLIVGIAIGAVLVVGGGVTALIIALSGDDNTTPAAAPGGSSQAAPAPSSSKKSSSSPKSSSSSTDDAGTPAKSGKPTPKETAEAVAQAYEAGNRQALQDTVCTSPHQEAPEIPAGITMDVTGEPEVTGDSALVPVKATGPAGTNSFELGLKNQGGVWCYAGDKTAS